MEPMTFVTPGRLDVEIRIQAGMIRARAIDTQETRVRIDGERSTEEVTTRLEPRPDGGHHLRIEHRPARRFGWGRDQGAVELELEIPLGTDLVIATASGDVETSGDVGGIRFRSASGGVRFERARGPVEIKVASGDARGDTAESSLRFESASGDLRIGQVLGDAVGRCASGDLWIEQAGGSVEAVSASGDVRVGQARRGEVRVRTVSGDVEIGVLPGTRVWQDVGSRTGKMVSELDGAAGEGEATLSIRADSVSGDIRIHRSAIESGAGDEETHDREFEGGVVAGT